MDTLLVLLVLTNHLILSVGKIPSFLMRSDLKEHIMAKQKEYILLPRKGLFSDALRGLEGGPLPSSRSKRSFTSSAERPGFTGGKGFRVIHSMADNGPKLVELDEEAAEKLDQDKQLRRAEKITYNLPRNKWVSKEYEISGYPFPPVMIKPPPLKLGKLSAVTIRVMEKKNGKRVPVGNGLAVIALSDYSEKLGDHEMTNSSGKVTLNLSGNTIERLYCPNLWGWGAFLKKIPIKPTIEIDLPELSEAFIDCVRRYYKKQPRFDPGIDVTVGVIDTGVGPHKDLHLIGGFNAVTGKDEKITHFHDVDKHGTFVAGLIGSRGILYPMLRGLAPGVRIRSYRVFGGDGTATNYDITKAMIIAREDKCDILNLSIESIENGLHDGALQDAIDDARNHGMIVVVAAGNDGRNHVDYPAAYQGAIAVSAMGCKETFPADALEETYVKKRNPKGNKKNEFFASFSNFGKEISVTALGVGVLSTLPRNKYGSCSGTSMAAPVVTGAAASLLSQNSVIFGKGRDLARSEAIEKLLLDNCVIRGFGPKYEGHGMPDPKKV
jgi:hypothetical protein